MNMFRNLVSAFLLAYAAGLVFGDPDKWTWIDAAGPTAVYLVHESVTFRPFVVGACVVIATALWMTRKQY
jgi:hypothetical protein